MRIRYLNYLNTNYRDNITYISLKHPGFLVTAALKNV